MKTKRAALYVRVSTNEQDTEAQERALRGVRSATRLEVAEDLPRPGLVWSEFGRPALNELLKACRRGSADVVVVWKFDRFARSLKQLMSGLETWRALGIDFVSVTEIVDTSLPAGELVFQMIGAFAHVREVPDRGTGEVRIGKCSGERESTGRPPCVESPENALYTGERVQHRSVSNPCCEFGYRVDAHQCAWRELPPLNPYNVVGH